MSSSPKLRGLLGILATGDAREEQELEAALAAGLGGVEFRCDLLLASGWPLERVLQRLKRLRDRGVGALFTVRRAGEGGAYEGEEAARLGMYRRALECGAALVDVEWGSPASRELAAEGAPLVLSHHDFRGMLSRAALDERTTAMASLSPRAIKIVPTASRLRDAVTTLDWVGAAPGDGPPRVGFAMGAAGVASRVLCVGRGAPFTYASLGPAVAPGQLPIREMLELYRVGELGPRTRVFGVAGQHALGSFSPYLHNPAFASRSIDAVYLPFQAAGFDEVLDVVDRLPIDGLSVTIPFKEEALRAADALDERSVACGASNTLVVRRLDPGRRIDGYNTDYDGVIAPLIQRLGDLEDVTVAVVGNGGAARGAVMALREAGACPTLYFRNPARGEPVARELGVPGRPLSELDGIDVRVIINATPLGTRDGDPAPVPDSVLRAPPGAPPRVAFEMVYQPEWTAFLRMARDVGALPVPGREMLVAQGCVQFRLFSSEDASFEEFAENYGRGEAYRAGS